jgi:hypothetical protein
LIFNTAFFYNCKIFSMTGWQIALADYQAGKGGYIVPSPDQVSTCQELINYKGQLTGYYNDLKLAGQGVKSMDNVNAIAELLRLIKAKIAQYDAAINACAVAADTGAGSTDGASQGTVDGGGSQGAALNPNGPAAMKPKNNNTKYIVIGIIAAAVLVTTAIIIRKRMKK